MFNGKFNIIDFIIIFPLFIIGHIQYVFTYVCFVCRENIVVLMAEIGTFKNVKVNVIAAGVVRCIRHLKKNKNMFSSQNANC